MRRVAVVGNSGSGKSTLARELAGRLGVPYVELDALFHLPGWTQLPEEEFRAAVDAVTAGEGWVVDGNYRAVSDGVWARADTVVWLDLPRPLVTWRIVRRSVSRAVSRQELWNGNRERWGHLLSLDPSRSVIAWSVTKHAEYRRRYGLAPADPALAHLRFVRLRSRAAVRRFLADG
jgi:adenylate kinase family enzyme